MQVLASCTLEEAKAFQGGVTMSSEDGSSNISVGLNVVCEDIQEVRGLTVPLPKAVRSISIKNAIIGDVPRLSVPVFRMFSLQGYTDYVENGESGGTGYISLVMLDDEFCDMRKLYLLSKKGSHVRFLGGNLLAVEGVSIGRFDNGKEKMSSVFNGVYDTFQEVPLSELKNVVEVLSKAQKSAIKKEKTAKSSKEKSAKTAVPKVNKAKSSFARLFG